MVVVVIHNRKIQSHFKELSLRLHLMMWGGLAIHRTSIPPDPSHHLSYTARPDHMILGSFIFARSIIFGFPLVQFDVAVGIEHQHHRDPAPLVAIYMAKYSKLYFIHPHEQSI